LHSNFRERGKGGREFHSAIERNRLLLPGANIIKLKERQIEREYYKKKTDGERESM